MISLSDFKFITLSNTTSNKYYGRCSPGELVFFGVLAKVFDLTTSIFETSDRIWENQKSTETCLSKCVGHQTVTNLSFSHSSSLISDAKHSKLPFAVVIFMIPIISNYLFLGGPTKIFRKKILPGPSAPALAVANRRAHGWRNVAVAGHRSESHIFGWQKQMKEFSWWFSDVISAWNP